MLVPLLDINEEDLSCHYIKTFAFDSHPICYTGGGGTTPTAPSICFLNVEDWKCVLSTVDKADMISPLGIKQEVQIAVICVEQLKAAGICSGSNANEAHLDDRCEYWSSRQDSVEL
jgi:hypothetical protein